MTGVQGSIDLKALAHDLLRNGQRQLQRQNRITPIVLIITAQEKLMYQIEEGDPEEREEVYSGLLRQAREKNALAIIALDHVSFASPQADSPGRAIMVNISGPGFEAWRLVCPFSRRGHQWDFQPVQEQHAYGAKTQP